MIERLDISDKDEYYLECDGFGLDNTIYCVEEDKQYLLNEETQLYIEFESLDDFILKDGKYYRIFENNSISLSQEQYDILKEFYATYLSKDLSNN
jgi:predicted RecB family nuclease